MTSNVVKSGRTNMENRLPGKVLPGKTATGAKNVVAASKRQAFGEIMNQINCLDTLIKDLEKPEAKFARPQSAALIKKTVKTASDATENGKHATSATLRTNTKGATENTKTAKLPGVKIPTFSAAKTTGCVTSKIGSSATAANTFGASRGVVGNRAAVKATGEPFRPNLRPKVLKTGALKVSGEKEQESRTKRQEVSTVNSGRTEDEEAPKVKKDQTDILRNHKSHEELQKVVKRHEELQKDLRNHKSHEELQKVVKSHEELDEEAQQGEPSKEKVEQAQKQLEDPEKLSYSSEQLEETEILLDNPALVSEYVGHIFEYKRSLEVEYELGAKFLEGHKTIPRMRRILVNWLVEVHENFHLLTETLHLCIAIVDHYLWKHRSIGKERLQLLGVTAMWVAAKYEEMQVPDRSDFVYMCDNACSGRQISQMEHSILRTLDFQLGRPLPIHFLRRFNKLAQVTAEHHALAKYLVELALLETELRPFRPSLQAAAAIFLSVAVLAEEPREKIVWTQKMVRFTQYTFKHLEDAVKLMARAILKTETSHYQAVKSKYATAANCKISLWCELKGPIIKKFAQIIPPASTSTSSS